MMEIIWSFLWFALGVLVASFCITQCFICLFFSIPLSIELKAKKILLSNKPLLTDLSCILVQSTFAIGLSYVALKFSNGTNYAYLTALTLFSLIGLSQSTRNTNNLSDYVDSNRRFLNEDLLSYLKTGTLEKYLEIDKLMRSMAS